MTTDKSPLTIQELEQMDALTEKLAEQVGPHDIDASFLDGFLTGWALLPNPPIHRQWLSLIFSKDGKPLPESEDYRKLRKLLMRRYQEISERLSNSEVVDPLRFEPEPEELLKCDKDEQLSYLSPFVNGLFCALYDVPNNLDFNDVDSVYPLVEATTNLESILGKEESEEGEEVSEEAQENSPEYDDFYDALEAIVNNVAVMAFQMKGYPLPEEVADKIKEEES